MVFMSAITINIPGIGIVITGAPAPRT